MARADVGRVEDVAAQTAEDSLADNNGEHAAHGRKQGRHGGWQAHRKERARQAALPSCTVLGLCMTLLQMVSKTMAETTQVTMTMAALMRK